MSGFVVVALMCGGFGDGFRRLGEWDLGGFCDCFALWVVLGV